MNSQKSSLPTSKKAIDGLAVGLTCVVAVASALGWLGSRHWAADLFAHFRAQYALLLLLLLAVHGLRRQPLCFVLAFGFLLLNVAQVAPVYIADPVDRTGAPDLELSVLQFNLLKNNARKRETAAYLETTGADVIVLQEVDQEWARVFAQGLRSYRPALVEARTTFFGIAIFVRKQAGVEIEHARLLRIDDEGWRHPAVEARLRHEGRMFEILGVHAHPPTHPNVARIHGVEIDRVARWSRERPGAHLVLGDLNITPWSARYGVLMSTSALQSARDGFGIVSSWRPMAGITGGLPLDHILHSREFAATRFERGPRLGSDHQPILARLRWKRTSSHLASLAARPRQGAGALHPAIR